MTSATTSVSHDTQHGHPTGLWRWLTTTNHKDLGTLYLTFALVMFLVGGVMILLVRAELLLPGLQVLDPNLYNQLVTLHGLVMVFGAIMPAATGLNNYLIPLMIGAPDMALPRVNNWGFWILHNSPLSLQAGIGMDFTILAIHLLGISSVSGAINVIVTALNMRAPGMPLMKMPLFVWSWLVTAVLIVMVLPVLSAVVTMLLTDRHFGTHFFIAAGGGDPIMFQHIFWFFGHAEVYIVGLRCWGLLPHILATFARKPVYGYKAQIYAFWGVGILGSIVWAHHMLTSGMPLAGNLYFMYATMSVSIPTAVLIFCWIATIWRGSMTFETPMLFALGAIAMFGIAGLTGLVLPDVAANAQYHNSYFVVAHFHYPFFGTAVLVMMAAAYYWLPKMTGYMYDEKLGRLHFWLTLVFFNVTFVPQFFAGLDGMPRHVADYALRFTEFNVISSVGAFLLGAVQLLFLYNIVQSIRGRGARATDRVWEGAEGLEFTLPSPPPYHSFTTPPGGK